MYAISNKNHIRSLISYLSLTHRANWNAISERRWANKIRGVPVCRFLSRKHTATGTWRIKPNDNKSIAIGNVLLSEAFFRKYGLDREISKLKAKGIDLAKPADGRATKFISDAMQKLTLTVRRKGMEGTEFILSNFNSLNQAILRAFGVIPEVF